MDGPSRHASDSLEQREAEIEVLRLVQDKVGCSLAAEVIALGGGVTVQVDGINRDHRVLCEVYSRIGKLKAGQQDKLASDMLKLVFLEHTLGGEWRKFICLADSEAARCVSGKSWLAAVAKRMGFTVLVVDPPQAVKDRLLAAQHRQILGK